MSDRQRSPLAEDFWGGLAAMLVAMPAAIAFGVAIFAPLPGEYAAMGALAGMLGITTLGLIAPMVGGAPRVIFSPCAPAAALLAALAASFADAGIAAPAIVLSMALIGLLCGLMQIGLGLSGVGRLIRYIPYPVVSGYMSGVGIIIISSQLPKLLGAPANTSLIDTLTHPNTWSWPALGISALVIIAMQVIPYVTQRIPATIIALLVGVSAYLGLALLNIVPLSISHNPLLIGELGKPTDGLLANFYTNWHAASRLSWHDVLPILVPAATLAALLSIDTLKTCVVVDALSNTQHDSNRTLVGQGLGNVGAALMGGVPGSATMGASLINMTSGGHTQLSGLCAGVTALIAFLALANVIAWIPIAALAAILIVVGMRMIDRHSIKFFFSPTTRIDFAVILTVIITAVFGSLIAASIVGVVLAILLFIREQTRATVIRHRSVGSDIRSRRRLQNNSVIDDTNNDTNPQQAAVVIYELQGSLFFGTANQLQSALSSEIGHCKYLVLNMHRVQSLDITATHVLEQIKERLEAQGALLIFCDIPKGLPSGLKMKRFLKATGLVRPNDKAITFSQVEEALVWINMQIAAANGTADPVNTTYDFATLPPLQKLNQDDLQTLEHLMELRQCVAGEKIFHVGSTSHELFFVRYGTVRVSLPIRKKQNYLLSLCQPGDVLGGMSFITGNNHMADAIALSDCAVYVLSRSQFEHLSQNCPNIAIVILESIAQQLSERLHVAAAEIQALRG